MSTIEQKADDGLAALTGPADPYAIEHPPIPPRSPEARAAIADVIRLLRERGFSLSHEDGHGAFIIAKRDPELELWFMQAWEQQ